MHGSPDWESRRGHVTLIGGILARYFHSALREVIAHRIPLLSRSEPRISVRQLAFSHRINSPHYWKMQPGMWFRISRLVLLPACVQQRSNAWTGARSISLMGILPLRPKTRKPRHGGW